MIMVWPWVSNNAKIGLKSSNLSKFSPQKLQCAELRHFTSNITLLSLIKIKPLRSKLILPDLNIKRHLFLCETSWLIAYIFPFYKNYNNNTPGVRFGLGPWGSFSLYRLI
jgi:hypothetical protein